MISAGPSQAVVQFSNGLMCRHGTMHDVRATKYWILAVAVVVILGGAGLVGLGVKDSRASGQSLAGSVKSSRRCWSIHAAKR